MIYLAKTAVTPQTEQRVIRMRLDARLLGELSNAEIRTIYSQMEETRDMISRLLDKADGK